MQAQEQQHIRGVEFICNKLHISHARFYKHMNLLIGAGIIEKQAVRNSSGLIERTIYTLTPNLQNDKTPLLDNLTKDNLQLDNLTGNNNNDNKNNIYIIVDYLNEKAGTHFKSNTAKTKSLINARLKEGFSVEDFKTVIDKKVEEWKNDVQMSKYIRPETLFGTKFEGYLNAKSCTGTTRNRFINFQQRETGQTEDELENLLLDNKNAPR
ncbi:MAG: conserved phage C-terminal domain-containing protein [Lachnospira sp.]